MSCTTKSSLTVAINSSPFPKILNMTKEIITVNDWENQVREWLSVLITENEKIKAEAHIEEGLAISEAFEFLHAACKKLNLSHEVKFLAIDIYQRFSLQHIESVTKSASELDLGDEDPQNFLAKVQDKVGTQAPLRVLTCLWISTKLSKHRTNVNRDRLQNLLRESGSEFTAESITKSELRILEHSNFDSRKYSTVLEYVGVLITYFGTVTTSKCSQTIVLSEDQIRDLFETALQMLEFVYLNYNKIYMSLFHKVTGSSIVSEQLRMQFSRVRCDRILLSASVVASACHLHGSKALCLFFLKGLSPILEIPKEDIFAFASCIVNHIITQTPP